MGHKLMGGASVGATGGEMEALSGVEGTPLHPLQLLDEHEEEAVEDEMVSGIGHPVRGVASRREGCTLRDDQLHVGSHGEGVAPSPAGRGRCHGRGDGLVGPSALVHIDDERRSLCDLGEDPEWLLHDLLAIELLPDRGETCDGTYGIDPPVRGVGDLLGDELLVVLKPWLVPVEDLASVSEDGLPHLGDEVIRYRVLL